MITKLEKKFTDKDGFLCEQVKETPLGYMYKVTSPHGNVQYEVFKKFMLHKLDPVTKEKLPELVEQYPKVRDFGFWAWYFQSRGQARNKLNEIKAVSKPN